MMVLPVTLTMAAAAVFVHIWLAMRCSRVRMRDNVSIGDGNSELLRTRMRAHGNFTENTPLFLILLGLLELSGSSRQWLWVAGIAFVLARISHAIGMERRSPNLFRAGGMVITLIVLAALAIAAILLSYEANQPVMIG
jgi:uncharacterized protein